MFLCTKMLLLWTIVVTKLQICRTRERKKSNNYSHEGSYSSGLTRCHRAKRNVIGVKHKQIHDFCLDVKIGSTHLRVVCSVSYSEIA